MNFLIRMAFLPAFIAYGLGGCVEKSNGEDIIYIKSIDELSRFISENPSNIIATPVVSTDGTPWVIPGVSCRDYGDVIKVEPYGLSSSDSVIVFSIIRDNNQRLSVTDSRCKLVDGHAEYAGQ